MNEPLLRVRIKLLTYPEIVYYAASRCTPALRHQHRRRRSARLAQEAENDILNNAAAMIF
jgi:hypothetical protein